MQCLGLTITSNGHVWLPAIAGAVSSTLLWHNHFSVKLCVLVLLQVILRYKLNFHGCANSDSWACFEGDCGTQISEEVKRITEKENEWCHSEGIIIRRVPSNSLFQLWWDHPVIPLLGLGRSTFQYTLSERHSFCKTLIAHMKTLTFSLIARLSGGNWLKNQNDVYSWSAVTLVELRNRSDTNFVNRSPQTTILPALR